MENANLKSHDEMLYRLSSLLMIAARSADELSDDLDGANCQRAADLRNLLFVGNEMIERLTDEVQFAAYAQMRCRK